jgi:hypothetical protein
MPVSTTVNNINTQTLAYLPSVIAGIQAAEAAAPEAPGASKLDAVLAGIGAGSLALAGTPNANVASIAALVNMSVMIFHLLGAFKHAKAGAVAGSTASAGNTGSAGTTGPGGVGNLLSGPVAL